MANHSIGQQVVSQDNLSGNSLTSLYRDSDDYSQLYYHDTDDQLRVAKRGNPFECETGQQLKYHLSSRFVVNQQQAQGNLVD